jgi:hypothetical protein
MVREAPSVGKRTTVIFDQKDRQYLESLIRDGKEPGIKAFIAKMMAVYRTMAIHDWKFPGEYYIGVSRAAFFSQQDIQLLIDLIPEESRRQAAQKIGEVTAISIRTSLNIDPHQRENWPTVLGRLQVFGYGDLTLRDDYIVVKNPFISNLTFLTGFLEGVLASRLEPKITTSPLVFEIPQE